MARGDFDTILTECLERLAQGESAKACLARYPQHAADLGPALAAAEALAQLGTYRLPGRAREAGRLRIRRALVESNRKARPSSAGRWARGLAGALAIFLIVAAFANLVRASWPGDWAYPYRLAAERLPARMAAQPARRVEAELHVADRRLADLESALARSATIGQSLQALLASDAAAVDAAQALPVRDQEMVAARLAIHAAALDRLAQVASNATVRAALADAAGQIRRLASGPAPAALPSPAPSPELTPAVTEREGVPTVEVARPTPAPTTPGTPTTTATATHSPEPVPTVRAIGGPTPLPTATLLPASATPTARPTLAPRETEATHTPGAPEETETPKVEESETPEIDETETSGDSSGPGPGPTRTPDPDDDSGPGGGNSGPGRTPNASGDGPSNVGTPSPSGIDSDGQSD
jgi:hypothetical protein